MPEQFTRQAHNTSYVAYTKDPSKKPVAVQVGTEVENLPVYSQVYIREFVSIEVDSIDAARSQEQRSPSLYVKFNAASAKNENGEPIGLRENFGASIQAGGELERAIRHALSNRIPLYVAIETKRKYRNADKEIVSYLTPINDLRGAQKDGKGTERSASMTRSNCSNVVVVVGPADNPNSNLISSEAVTNPLQWNMFRSNHEGDLIPAGFIRAIDAEGNPTGAIIERASAPAPSAATVDVDVDALAEAVAARILASSGPNGAPQAPGARPPLRNAHAMEAKPWDPFNSDGRVNAGSYLISGWRNTWAGAMILLENAIYNEQMLAEQEQRQPHLLDMSALTMAATNLTTLLLVMADQVQAAVVGQAKRMDRSHGEAGKWIHQIASRLVPFELTMLSDDTARATWRKTVVAQATAAFGGALQSVGAYLDEQYGTAAPVNDASRSASRQAEHQARRDESAAAPEPTRGATQGSETVAATTVTSAAADAELMQRWRNLLTRCKLAGHEHLVAPFLVKVCHTADLTQVAAENFAERIAIWEDQPQRFIDAARTAYEATQPKTA
ncbi:hypothetical protein BO226_24500 (plasmid) [Rhodococcus sp. 2G]|uniref:hypothetical protein n=1 Tax=Rhodococcus sp. 2G TaxID=1570939 RepID=UPI0009032C41|nr:hypothetical protein [Rhodococcus sp. 2G]APE12528.1 hypothetical protein BO226_24500 [Rhodococcus sp. 2G]